MTVLHEWIFHNRVCRVVESEPGIVHFEEASRTTGDPSVMLFNWTVAPFGAANEIIQLSMALAEANVINRDLSASIAKWQEERNCREQEVAALRRDNRHLRRGWGWERCGTHAYHDDGELSCGGATTDGSHEHRAIDWMRDPVDQIEAALRDAGVEWMKAHPHEVTAAMTEKVELAKEIEELLAKNSALSGRIKALDERVAELEAALVKASTLFPVVPPIPLPEGKSEPDGQDPHS